MLFKTPTFSTPILSGWGIGIAIAGIFPASGLAQPLQRTVAVPSYTTDLAQADPSENAPRRIRPTFSEEERRGFDQKGFSNFLEDALNGNSDPLGGGTIGGEFDTNAGLTPLSGEERGFTRPFDPTDVIIPRSGLRR
jgi:hypothetical protein